MHIVEAIRNEILLTIEREGRVQAGDIDTAIRKAMAATGETAAEQERAPVRPPSWLTACVERAFARAEKTAGPAVYPSAASIHEANARAMIDMLCRSRPQLGLTVMKAPDGTYQIKGQCAGHSFDKRGVPGIDLAWSIFKAADTLIETAGARRAGMPKGE